ncbi:MAG TPA: DUF4340 domain-containing protein, partial [Nitrospirae bacterium]|nr:DUF4340 domain-containing protein [Nitrospirota bacterium]
MAQAVLKKEDHSADIQEIAMTLKKEHIILIIIIVALSVYLFVRKEGEIHYDLPEIKHIDKSDISRLTIKKKGSEIRLKRDNKRWIVSPGNVPADGGKVDKMLSDISGLKLTAVVSESKNYPLYKLDEAHRIEVEAFKGDDSLIKIEIGKPAQSGRHTYIKLGNDQRVFLVSNELRSGFDKTVASLRDRLVMKIVEQINEVRLYDGKRKMTIVRSEAAAPVNV